VTAAKSRVGLDLRMWEHPGIGRYLRELFFAMLRKKPEASYRLLLPQNNRQSFQNLKADIEFQNAFSSIYGLAEQWELLTFSKKTSLLHVPHFNIPVMGKAKLVVTVHDLVYLKDTRYSGSRLGRAYVNFLFKKMEKKADAILAVSEYTKTDLLEHFPKLKGRVFVTHEAASHSFQPVNDPVALECAKKKYSLNHPFVLFVGSLKAHKNVPALIEAMFLLRKEKGIKHELVLVGRQNTKESALQALIKKNSSFVKVLGSLMDEELVLIYNLAEAFVLPSLWEGFGLPVVEAMACGTPVLASDRASLPEVAGEAGLLFDPERVDDLKELLYNVLQSSELRQKMRVNGLLQAKKFSWDKTAAETLDVYERVLG
jgi:glycosyltransferase involved in cell wall biosynthesis